MIRLQNTIRQAVSITGKGLHTGKISSLTFLPAPENHGVVFQRMDLPEMPKVQAHASKVTDTQLGTTLREGKATVQTIEHVLAALTGLKIDNVLVQMTTSEPPIMDGSSIDFVKVLKQSGVKTQSAPIEPIIVEQTITYHDPQQDVWIQVTPADKFQIEVEVEYDSVVAPKQNAGLEQIEDFETEIADARTFCFLRDVLYLHSIGLVQGGSPQNAIVIVDSKESPENLKKLADLYEVPYSEVKMGYLQTELRWENELAKHKLLDMIGDLSLVGKPIIGKIKASKPGHKANTELAKMILKACLQDDTVKL